MSEKFEFENESCIYEPLPGFWAPRCKHAVKNGTAWMCQMHRGLVDRQERACFEFEKDTKKYESSVKIY